MHHRGRRSGTEYATPIAIVPTTSGSQDTLLVGLPWGATTNWAQNVLAAGAATLTWKSRDIAVTNPRIVGTDVAVAAARPALRRVLGSGRFPAFLQLDRA
jgi:deazaflavin-dependent oxidoreductase (nitroreductase family)